MFYSTNYASPVGAITLACDGENLVGLWMAGQKYFAETVTRYGSQPLKFMTP